jgi:hypothetical protein
LQQRTWQDNDVYFSVVPTPTQTCPLRQVVLDRERFAHLGRVTPLLLACLTALLCIISPPVFAHLSSEIPVTQGIAATSQLLQQGRDYYEDGQFAAALKVWQQAAQAYQSQDDRLTKQWY